MSLRGDFTTCRRKNRPCRPDQTAVEGESELVMLKFGFAMSVGTRSYVGLVHYIVLI